MRLYSPQEFLGMIEDDSKPCPYKETRGDCCFSCIYKDCVRHEPLTEFEPRKEKESNKKRVKLTAIQIIHPVEWYKDHKIVRDVEYFVIKRLRDGNDAESVGSWIDKSKKQVHQLNYTGMQKILKADAKELNG